MPSKTKVCKTIRRLSSKQGKVVKRPKRMTQQASRIFVPTSSGDEFFQQLEERTQAETINVSDVSNASLQPQMESSHSIITLNSTTTESEQEKSPNSTANTPHESNSLHSIVNMIGVLENGS